MGNSHRKEPSRSASSTLKQSNLQCSLAKFYNQVPIEVQVYTMSFLPLDQIPNLFTINKLLYQEMKINDQIFANYYEHTRKENIKSSSYRSPVFKKMPKNITRYKLRKSNSSDEFEISNCSDLENGYCENYNKLKQAFDDVKRFEYKIMNAHRSVECK
ncbi:predicted protein [Naegleria gruberi]|uniref:Predicted protein n=1 Tax=Naegleria gruberi TaxID=5762 RepID=D2VKP0_NAEGR|nr:uncharacterized protein NAEGRDRAFT_69461 [Naegleria gruberi]EFC42724.1 predicted protein [Naegleria gruberi]|eukprot:XP_002675468.1 predicted protein [Naegleria gruberi strain NEG-M]